MNHIGLLILLISITVSDVVMSASKCADIFDKGTIPQTNLRTSSTATALRAVGREGEKLTYQDDYYPTQSAARIKTTRFDGVVVDGRGAEISIYFETQSRNIERNGLRSAIWEETGDASIYARPHSGIVSQEVQLRFEGFSYKTQFTAMRRVAKYTGIVVNKDGSKNRIYVRVNERNLEPNGLREPRWERSGDATLFVEPTQD